MNEVVQISRETHGIVVDLLRKAEFPDAVSKYAAKGILPELQGMTAMREPTPSVGEI